MGGVWGNEELRREVIIERCAQNEKKQTERIHEKTIANGGENKKNK